MAVSRLQDTPLRFSRRGWDSSMCFITEKSLLTLVRALLSCRHVPKHPKEVAMNWEQAKGNWKQFKGKVKEKWGRLTDDELDEIEGKRDQLLGKIQKQYGITKEEAERQVGDWERHL